MNAMLRRALRETLGLRQQLERNLLGDDGNVWEAELKKFLRKERCWAKNNAKAPRPERPKELAFLRRMTVAIGGISKEDLLREIEAENTVSAWARDIYGKPEMTVPATAAEVNFGWAAVGAFGFTKVPTTPELYARIREVGNLCRREDGPHLRRADKDQPRGTAYWVPMDPMIDSHSRPQVWYLGRGGDGERWLDTRYAYPVRRWDLGYVVVLRLRK